MGLVWWVNKKIDKRVEGEIRKYKSKKRNKRIEKTFMEKLSLEFY
jgi:hypothetical protein